MDLRELGALLKAERERRGISPNDVTEQIKISRSTLEAIEEGQEDKLPHKVYAKGFIKNYARLMDFDADEVAEVLSVAFGMEDDVLSRPAYQESKGSVSSIKTGQSGGKKSSTFGIILLLLLVLGGGALWYFSFLTPKTPVQSEQGDAQPQAESPAASPAGLADGAGANQPQEPASSLDTPVGQTPPVQEELAQPQTSSETMGAPAADGAMAEQAPADASSSPAGEVPVQAPDENPVQDAAGAVLPEDGVIMGEGPNVVVITAKENCWLEAAADGGAMNELTLRKGQSLTGRFDDVLLVRLGNAGGVDIHFNGKPYVFDGSNGQVKTLKFTTKKSVVEPENPQPSPAAAQETAPGAEANAAGETTAEAAPAGAQTLTAYGADGSWIIVIPDGKGAKEIFVKRGEKLQFGFQKTIEVRLGNPSKLVFTYDGKEYPVSSEKGESKTVRFPQ